MVYKKKGRHDACVLHHFQLSWKLCNTTYILSESILCHSTVVCVVGSNPYQLSCPGSSVGGAFAKTAECRGFESHPGQLFLFSLGVAELFALPCLSTSLPSCWDIHVLSLEFGVFGGLITPVCSYILSESILCHSTVVWGLPCVVLCCVVLYPYQLSCPGSSVDRALA